MSPFIDLYIGDRIGIEASSLWQGRRSGVMTLLSRAETNCYVNRKLDSYTRYFIRDIYYQKMGGFLC